MSAKDIAPSISDHGLPVPPPTPSYYPSITPAHPKSSQTQNGQPKKTSRVKAKLTNPFRKPPTKFTLFGDLPTEIRLKIWDACIEPRVHELHPCANLYHNRMTFRSNAAATPSIFHVNRESREVAKQNYKLMEHNPNEPADDEVPSVSKGILRFYFAPKHDTLLLNSLMGLFVMFMLLEEVTEGLDELLSNNGSTAGIMAGWERVAIDADRASLITLLAGSDGRSPQPKFKKLLPDMKELVLAFDHTRSGKTRFRTSVWPGENGTSLRGLRPPKGQRGEWIEVLDHCLMPLKKFLKNDYLNGVEAVKTNDVRDRRAIVEKDFVPDITAARVERKSYIRGDIRYAIRWTCAVIGVRPRGVLRRF